MTIAFETNWTNYPAPLWCEVFSNSFSTTDSHHTLQPRPRSPVQWFTYARCNHICSVTSHMPTVIIYAVWLQTVPQSAVQMMPIHMFYVLCHQQSQEEMLASELIYKTIRWAFLVLLLVGICCLKLLFVVWSWLWGCGTYLTSYPHRTSHCRSFKNYTV